jgi:hypothetical protein
MREKLEKLISHWETDLKILNAQHYTVIGNSMNIRRLKTCIAQVQGILDNSPQIREDCNQETCPLEY